VNYEEAGETLIRLADLFPLFYAITPQMKIHPVQTMRDRKVAMIEKEVKLFEEGKCWERGIKILDPAVEHVRIVHPSYDRASAHIVFFFFLLFLLLLSFLLFSSTFFTFLLVFFLFSFFSLFHSHLPPQNAAKPLPS
jgi:hypothetical protein